VKAKSKEEREESRRSERRKVFFFLTNSKKISNENKKKYLPGAELISSSLIFWVGLCVRVRKKGKKEKARNESKKGV
jgi:hypothetical protein